MASTQRRSDKTLSAVNTGGGRLGSSVSVDTISVSATGKSISSEKRGKSRKKRLTVEAAPCPAVLSPSDTQSHRRLMTTSGPCVPSSNGGGASGASSVAAHNHRRGIYNANELLHHKDAKAYDQEFGHLESVSVIRFPADIASLLRQRLAANAAEIEATLASESPSGADDLRASGKHEGFVAAAGATSFTYGGDLGLTITPTPEEDYRIFEVTVEKELGDPNSQIHLCGILLELPCLLEAYKSLEGELLFKCNDISQILYVYRKGDDPPFNIQQKKTLDLWEWRSGLTPGTHRIRSRKFKNFNVFEKADVSRAEREICDILNSGGIRETTALEASTEFVMEAQLDAICTGQQQAIEKNVVGVIGPENPIFKAALMGVTPAEAAQHFPSPTTSSSLLRNLVQPEKQKAPISDLRERLLFSVDLNMELPLTEAIPDDLSDRLFGDVEGFHDDDEIEEDIQHEDEEGKDDMDDILDEVDEEDDEDLLDAGSSTFDGFADPPASRLTAHFDDANRRTALPQNPSLATQLIDQSSFSASSEEEDAKARRERRQRKKLKSKAKSSSQDPPTTTNIE